MKALLVRVHDEKIGRRGVVYRRLILQSVDGTKTTYFCDAVLSFDNYRRWKVIIEDFERRGRLLLGNLQLHPRRKKFIDADSHPHVLLQE